MFKSLRVRVLNGKFTTFFLLHKDIRIRSYTFIMELSLLYVFVCTFLKCYSTYLFMQKDQLSKGVRDMKQKHMAALLTSIEKGISAKLKEKDVEIENMNRKSRELAERIKQVTVEAQSWHYRAKYNETVVHALRNNLQQAISQGAEQGKEGFGDSEVDDDASYIDPNNFLNIPGVRINPTYKSQQDRENLTCRACKAKAVSMLLMPCRHLCLCKDCEGFINVCPVCQMVKTAGVEVYLS